MILSSDLLDNLPELRNWQPTPIESTFDIDKRNANRMAALFDMAEISAGGSMPPLWHWAFFQGAVKQQEIGADGHPKKGGFLPPISLPRRMFAGSSLSFQRPLIVGETYHYNAGVKDISVKQGKSGKLAFVRIEHQIAEMDGSSCLSESQDIVYREASTESGQPNKSSGCDQTWDWEEKVTADPVMLFRYSAVTYNSHRIHFDLRYATQVEGYAGLIVHGPLLATLMTKAICERIPASRLARFKFAGKAPVFGGSEFQVAVRRSSNPKIVETAIVSAGSIAMTGMGELE